MRRLLVVLVVICTAFVACVGAASAAAGHGGIDRSFGNHGFIAYKHPRSGYRATFPTSIATDPQGRIYLLEDAIYCDWGCSTDVYLTRLLPDGSPDLSFAGGDGIKLFQVGPGLPYSYTTLVIDGRGRVTVGVREKEAFSFLRLEPDGSPDASFGDDGRVLVGCQRCDEIELTLDPLGGGRALLWGSRTGWAPGFPAYTVPQTKLLLGRLTPGGEIERGFGKAGWTGTTLLEAHSPSAVITRSGAATVAGSLSCCSSVRGIYLARFRSDGSFDLAFARRSARSLARLHLPLAVRPDSVEAIVPRRHGAFDLVGSTAKGGYVLRFRRNGTLDGRFGHRGLRRIKWAIQATAPAGGGRLWAVGGSNGSAMVFRISPNGTVDRSFGGKGSAINLPRWEQSGTTLVPQGRGVVLFSPGYEIGCRQFCPPSPRLARIAAPRPPRRSHR